MVRKELLLCLHTNSFYKKIYLIEFKMVLCVDDDENPFNQENCIDVKPQLEVDVPGTVSDTNAEEITEPTATVPTDVPEIDKEMDQSSVEDVNKRDDNKLVDDILDIIQKCPANFKSQQLNDPDLEDTEKRKIAKDLLFKNPMGFLYRFGSFLKEDNFKVFNQIDHKIEVDYYIEKLLGKLKKEKSTVRNRRFEALERLKIEGKYFSHSEMQEREPLLYYQLVGQFLSEKEKKQHELKESNSERLITSFSGFLVSQMDKDNIQMKQQCQEEEEEGMKRSYDDSDDELEDVEMNEQEKPARWGEDWTDVERDKKKRRCKKVKTGKLPITAEEKALLLNEFTTHMHTRFLDGLDTDFDYSVVDANPDYDCLTVQSQDDEEKYFDDETCDDNLCTDTGVEDY